MDPMIDSLAGSNPALKALFENMGAPPTPEERQGALQRYTGALQNQGPPQQHPFVTAAQGIMSSKDPFNPMVSPVAGIQNLMAWDQTQHEAKQKGELLAAKAEYDDMIKRQSEYQQMLKTGMTGVGRNGRLAGVEFRTLSDGTVGVFNRGDGTPVGVYGPKEIKTIAELTKTYVQIGKEKGEFQSLDELNQWATQQAMAELERMNSNRGNVPGTQQGQGAQQQKSADQAPPSAWDYGPASEKADWVMEQTPNGRFAFDVTGMSSEDKDLLGRVINRYKNSPNEGTMNAIKPIITDLLSQGKLKTTPGTSSAETLPPMMKKDPRAEARKEEFGKKEAATLEKALTDSYDLYKTNAGLLSELGNLEGIYSMKNIPKGEFAEMFTKAASGLESFGIKADPSVGPAQTAIAIANGMALRMRTAGGSNLMPGQMSNFDAQMLQSMAPRLSMSEEGRMMLIQMMKNMADSQMRIAKAAQDFADQNGGMLTPEWRKEAMSMERREMARRELMRRQIMKKFGGQ